MASQPFAFFAAGTTLAGMTNIQVTSGVVFHPLDYGRIPLLPPIKSRAMDGFPRRDGKLQGRLIADVPKDTERKALNTMLFASQLITGAELFVSALADDGYYYPFQAIVDRPYEIEDYALTTGGVYVRTLALPLFDCRVQSATKTSNYTVTTADHLLYANTASGSITFALPPVATVAPYVVYTGIKTSASNNLVYNPDGSETINGASTLTVTALDARTDYYTPDNLVWRTL